MGSDKIYIAIDLKSFYASVEAVDLGLDPLTANLVVADPSRTEIPFFEGLRDLWAGEII